MMIVGVLIIDDDDDEHDNGSGFTSFISFTVYQDLTSSHFHAHDFILLGQVEEVQKEKEAK